MLVVQCARSHIKTLYLARYLLELSLMEYKLVFHSESKTAASCLYIARRMRGEGGWVSGLRFIGERVNTVSLVTCSTVGCDDTEGDHDECNLKGYVYIKASLVFLPGNKLN